MDWAKSPRDGVRWAARALATALEAEERHGEWRRRGWQALPPRRWTPRSQPQRVYGPPRRPFPGRPGSWQWKPYFYGEPRWPGNWPREAPEAYPRDWRPRVLPRRGPPVATIPAPFGYRQERWKARQPRGVKPRGTLRGGPERTADDPRRKPRGGLCGGPGRSAKEPQTPNKITRQNTTGGKAAKGNEKTSTRPTIITVDRSGMVRRWG